jgi:ABC-type uncharacterized transport system permease subunit
MSSGVSIICFAATYGLTLLLEVVRLVHGEGRRIALLTLVVATAGVVAHSWYLVNQARDGLLHHHAPLSSWYHWYLIAGWVLAFVYLCFSASRPRTAVGIFLLPLVLVLVGLAGFHGPEETLPAASARRVWATIHGGMLLLGTVVVFLGFAAGVMFLLQSYRLKHKLLPSQGMRLPSLEWLQRTNERSLVVSSFLLAGGVLSGIALNLVRRIDGMALSWTDPVVLSSAVLFLWLLAACLFSAIYRPARQGRKVAYLTVVSFLFLALVLVITVFGPSTHIMRPPADVGDRRSSTSAAGDAMSSCEYHQRMEVVG